MHETNFSYKQDTVEPKDVKNPWMSNTLNKSSIQKQKLYVKYLKQKTTESEKTYKYCKNLFNNLIKKAKNNFYLIRVIKISRKYQEIMANNERNNR